MATFTPDILSDPDDPDIEATDAELWFLLGTMPMWS
jgi:hypothetical protein